MHLDAIKDNVEQGTNLEVPDAPLRYNLLVYRRKMRISWAELMATPWEVIEQDIYMMNQEQEFRPRKGPAQ